MDRQNWALVVRAMAIMAEIEGMKALNQFRLGIGSQIAHNDSHFYTKAEELEKIADQLNTPK